MATKMKEFGIDQLTVDERLDLMHEIWDSIASEPDRPRLTDARREELERRQAEHEANPDDVVSWEEVRRRGLNR